MSGAHRAGEHAAISRKHTALRKQTLKADDELRVVWAEVYVPGFPDSQGDFMTTEEVRKMAHSFVAKGETRCIDVNHDGGSYDACVVESFIARKGDPDFIEGSWVVGVHVSDQKLWDRVKKGELNGFSMEALVTSVPCEVDFDVPEDVSCLTMKHDDSEGHPHQHVARVKLDAEGNILGGETDFVCGHRHIIKRGTLTEIADDHRHRYSFLEHVKRVA